MYNKITISSPVANDELLETVIQFIESCDIATTELGVDVEERADGSWSVVIDGSGVDEREWARYIDEVERQRVNGWE